MAERRIVELRRGSSSDSRMIVVDTVKIERKLFPKHESLSSFFQQELTKNNVRLLYSSLIVNGGFKQVNGYAMYSFHLRFKPPLPNLQQAGVRETPREYVVRRQVSNS